jgi:hypothetical protein
MQANQILRGRKLVVVLGMHRSGTSAVTAALHALGLWTGKPESLLGATPENARGYWELRELVTLDDEILRALGSAWEAPHVPPVVHLGAARYAEFAERARRLLIDAFDQSPHLAIKDPRMCRLLDFWIVQFEALGLDVRYVLTLRDPIACAMSLQKRDRLPLDLGRWLWIDHLTSACNQTAGRNRLFISYERLLDAPAAQLARLAAFAGVQAPQPESTADAVIAPELCHQRRQSCAQAAHDDDDALGHLDQQILVALLPQAEDGASHDDGMHAWHTARRHVMRLRAGRGGDDLGGLPLQNAAPAKTAVMLHVYYPQQWPELLALLEHLAPDIDIFASVTGPQAPTLRALIAQYDPAAQVVEMPNRGRDIAPFLALLPALIAQQYDCVCKLHTKQSNYAQIDGRGWRFDLWSGLIGRGDEVQRIRMRFRMDATLGMLGLRDYWVCEQDFRDSRHDRVVELATTLLAQRAPENWHFFAGTMFWFRPQALRPLLSLGVEPDDFESEQGQREGTLAHAFERLLPLAVRASRHWIDAFHPAPLQRAADRLPTVFARTSTEQILEELGRVRDQLAATEKALGEAQKLAIARLEQIDTLQSALAHAQELALQRMAYINALHESLFGRIALKLKLFKPECHS